ncbi:hypothetical protein ARMGADRAFT_896693, partial [Armillaria gallica]
VASWFTQVSPEAVHVIAEQMGKGDIVMAETDEEYQALTLMCKVKAVTSHVAGSSSSCSGMRNKIRGLTIDKGLSSFYITINPADMYNPTVKFL